MRAALLLAAAAVDAQPHLEPQRVGGASSICDESILTECLAAFDDYACVVDMKRCLENENCLQAGIDPTRICECYLKVELPLNGRVLSEYDCHPSPMANTILADWRQCKHRGKTEL